METLAETLAELAQASLTERVVTLATLTVEELQECLLLDEARQASLVTLAAWELESRAYGW